jgi:predicted nucleic acid-binding Zn ribbon protein
MSQKEFIRVGQILPALLRSIGLEKKFKEREILSLWPAIVGEDIAARTRAVRIEKGVLHIQVDHGAWIQELHFMEKTIIRRLREKAPTVDIRRIHFGTKS